MNKVALTERRNPATVNIDLMNGQEIAKTLNLQQTVRCATQINTISYRCNTCQHYNLFSKNNA